MLLQIVVWLLEDDSQVEAVGQIVKLWGLAQGWEVLEDDAFGVRLVSDGSVLLEVAL